MFLLWISHLFFFFFFEWRFFHPKDVPAGVSVGKKTWPQIMYRESYEVHDMAAGVDLFFIFYFLFLVSFFHFLFEFPSFLGGKWDAWLNVPKQWA